MSSAHEQSADATLNATYPRIAAVALVLIGCAAALATHIVALYDSGLDPLSSPIGALSRTADAVSFHYGLWLFAAGHLALVFLVNRSDAGRVTRCAQLFLLLDAALIAWLPRYFATVQAETLASAISGGPLWLLGGSVGFAMTCVAVALWRRNRSAALLTLVFLLLWTGLAPAFLVVDPGWVGAYERFVGTMLVAWMAVVAMMIGLRE